MCMVLYLNRDVFAKRNHKGLTTKQFHRLFNKSITIATKERDTNNIFVPTSVAAGYACNSVPIDSTNILRSISAIGWEHYFIFDSLTYFPKLIQNNGQAALYYLKLANSSHHFSTSILKYFLKIFALLTPSVLTIIEVLLFKSTGYCDI